MRWINRARADGVGARIGWVFLFAFALGSALLLSGDSSDQKIISVYSPVANYSLPLSQQDGRDYVGLLEMLEPLGSVGSRVERQNWRLRFNGVEGIFSNGSARARLHNRDLDLTARFVLESGRGLVPVDSLVTLLPGFLGIPVVFHSTARRLFIRQEGTTYTPQLNTGNPTKLVLNFSSPVNPRIATEPGQLQMTFTRDPVVASGPPTVAFNTVTIASATFSEGNGAAELTIRGSVPLLASFGNDGRTITIAPAPSASASAQTSTASALPPSVPPLSPPAGSTVPAVAPASGPTAPVFALIDAGHGGTETGATFNSSLLEKDVTLAFARQLRQEFQAKGLSATLLRDSDIALTPDQRASMANAARPALYICLHAASDGKGARVYTALLSPTGQDSGLFVAWDRAQASALASSQALAASITAELTKNMSARTASAGLRPLANIVAPAVAIEVAPRNGDVADLAATDYQQQVATSVVVGVTALREKLEAAR